MACGTNLVNHPGLNGSLTYGQITIDGYTYPTIIIGSQEWLAVNLLTTLGITVVDNAATWMAATTPACCKYDGDDTLNIKLDCAAGYLFNWYAVASINSWLSSNGFSGWAVPTSADVTTLTTYVGASPANALRVPGTSYWSSEISNPNNSSGFSALPAGNRASGSGENGEFVFKNLNGAWWTSTSISSTNASFFSIFHTSANVTTGSEVKKEGLSIRLVRAAPTPTPSCLISCSPRAITTAPDPLILNPGVAANFTISVPYVNGNGLAFTIPSVSSTGATGLTIASLSGTLINGSGTLVFSVTGTPSASGTALFNLDIFDNEICPLAYTVQDIIPNNFNNSDGCPGQEVIFYNYNCDIVEDVTNITVGGIAVSEFQVSTVTNPCQIQFTIPLNVSINRSVQVKFYDGASELESLPFFIKPCGGNYFNPDSTTGSPGCSNITFTNSDCSIIDKLDSITFEGVEAEYYIIQNSSPCKIGISIPDFKPRAGFPTYATVSFNGADGRSILTESYLVTAGCDGRTDDVTEPDLTCGEIQLLSSDNLTFLDCNNNPIRFEEGEPFTKTGWTISFSTELGVWSSRHTYQPYMYMYNSKGMYTLTKIVDTDSLWKHTEKATRLSYYGDNQSKFEVDMIFPGEDKRTTTGTSTTKNTNKIFSAFAVSSDSFEEDLNLMRNKFNIPFNQFYVYNSFQISGLVDINYLENLRRVDGSWVINEFRDLAKYGNISDGLAQLSPGLGEQMFLSEGEINNNYIDNNKNWYNKRKFVDKWIGLRLIYNPAITSNVDLVYLYNVVFNSRPSFR